MSPDKKTMPPAVHGRTDGRRLSVMGKATDPWRCAKSQACRL